VGIRRRSTRRTNMLGQIAPPAASAQLAAIGGRGPGNGIGVPYAVPGYPPQKSGAPDHWTPLAALSVRELYPSRHKGKARSGRALMPNRPYVSNCCSSMAKNACPGLVRPDPCTDGRCRYSVTGCTEGGSRIATRSGTISNTVATVNWRVVLQACVTGIYADKMGSSAPDKECCSIAPGQPPVEP
jgi:hypothetical protein